MTSSLVQPRHRGRARLWARAAWATVIGSIVLTGVGVSTASASEPPPAARSAGGTALPAPTDAPGTEYIVQLEDGVDVDEVVADVAADGIEVTAAMEGAVDGFSAPLDAAAVAELRARDDVVRVEREHALEFAGVQDNPPWNLNRIDQRSLPLDAKYSYRNTGTGVDVYVIDSGIRLTQTEFTGRLSDGAFIDFGDGNGLNDCYGHGTSVSSVVGGTTWGVAKGVSIIPVNVLQCGQTSISPAAFVTGVNWVVEHHQAGQPAVVNISLSTVASQVIDDTVKALITDGITVMVAAGNDPNTSSCNQSPTRLPEAITVAASDSSDARASFSSPGSCTDLFAPGVDIRTASFQSDSGSVLKTGTSSAAPHVSGAAAQILQQNPTFTPAQVWAAMDADTTKGVITGRGTGDPDKLLHVTPQTVANAPTGLTAAVWPAAGVGAGQVKLTWTAPFDGGAAITDYVIERSTNQTTWTALTDGVSTATTYTDSGLAGGTSHWYRVSAKNSIGTGATSATTSATPATLPAAPSGLTGAVAPAAGVGSGQVKLSWTAPSANGSAVTDYIVEISTNQSSWATIVDGVSTTTTLTINGLTNGTPYWFRVSAKNSVGTGPTSTTTSATPVTLPGAPSGLTAAVAPAAGVGSGEVKLSWSAPNDGGTAITDYIVERSVDQQSWVTVADGVSTATSHTVTGLTNGTLYVFRISAKNAVGTGSTSATVFATPAALPAAPSGLSAAVAPASGVGSGEVKLSWTAAAANGSAITDYLVERSTDGATWTRVDDGVATATTSTVRGLVNGTQHQFRVAAVNGVGTSPWTATATATPVGSPESPGGLTAAVAPAAGVGAGQVRLTWTAPATNGVAITDYLISVAESGTSWTTVDDGVSTATSFTVGGLVSGRDHEFRVAAINSVGTGTWSATVNATPAGPPAAVAGLRVTDIGSGLVQLAWNQPAGNGSAISDYLVERSTDGVNWTSIDDGVSTATTATVTGLVNGTSYRFRVTAHNSVGDGPASDPIQATPAGTPAAVGQLSATVAPDGGVGSGQVKLAWSAPTDNGGSAVVDYVIERSTDGATWTTVNDGVSTATTFTVDGLTNGTSYHFRVTARNSAGDGPASSTIEATPAGTPAAVGQVGATVAPDGGVGSGQVKLAWSAPGDAGGSAILDYVIERSTDGTTWATISDSISTATTFTVDGLTNGTAYQFRVTAHNAVGAGPASSAVQATPRWTPSGPGGLSAAVAPSTGVGSGQVKLSWAAPADNGAAVIDFVVRRSTNGTTWTTLNDGTSIATTLTVSGLTNGTAYQFRIAAVNEVGPGAWSTPVAATPRWKPAAPGGLRGVPASRQVTLTWNAPAGTGGSNITDYVIQRSANGKPWTTVRDSVSTTRRSVVGGLTNGTSYRFRVAAKNAVGTGPWSAAVRATPRAN